ncbi:MAG: PIG-L deacetylase family protein [bacterium]|nr:PIG-L deacetylase family protein [bacterium]
MKKIVIISPHPDDDVIGMGGTIAKFKSENYFITCLYITQGCHSPSNVKIEPNHLAKVREKEAKKSALILGIDQTIFLRFKDIKENNQAQKVHKELEFHLSKLHPEEIYLPHPQEQHLTHKIITELSLNIAKSYLNYNASIFGYEVWTPIINPTMFMDITSFVELKREAILAHKSQIEEKSYDEGILGLNRYRAVFLHINKINKERYIEVFERISI